MISRLLLALIRLYWWTLSPLIGSVCRFQPSCSRYTAVCIDRFGPLRGSAMGVVRICKCQPFHPGGYDPPPPRPGAPPSREAPRSALPGLAPEKDAERVHPSRVSSNLAPASQPRPGSS